MPTEEPPKSNSREVVRWSEDECLLIVRTHIKNRGNIVIGKKHVLAAQEALPQDRRKHNPQFALFKKLNELMALEIANPTEMAPEPEREQEPTAPYVAHIESLPMPAVPHRIRDYCSEGMMLEELLDIVRRVLALNEHPMRVLVELSDLDRKRLQSLTIQACNGLSSFEELLSASIQ